MEAGVNLAAAIPWDRGSPLVYEPEFTRHMV